MAKTKITFLNLILLSLGAFSASASEADIHIPPLDQVRFEALGGMSGVMLMYIGIVICAIGAIFGLVQYRQTKALPVHESMSNVSHTIWETCKTYLFNQGRFLAILWALIAACMVYYFGFLTEHTDAGGQPLGAGHVAINVVVILLASILGILGSYGVAWFGIRINTVANSRTSFSALKGDLRIKPLKVGFAAYYESVGRVDLVDNHPGEKPVSISGKDVRKALIEGREVDPRIMRPTTAHILAAAMAGQ